jgi:hypothetical protein
MTADPNPVVMPIAPTPVAGNPDPTAVRRRAGGLNDQRRPDVSVGVSLGISGVDGQQSCHKNGQNDRDPEDLQSSGKSKMRHKLDSFQI